MEAPLDSEERPEYNPSPCTGAPKMDIPVLIEPWEGTHRYEA